MKLTSRTRRAGIATVAALTLVSIAAGPAAASQVWMDPGVDRLVAGGGEYNDVTVDVLGPNQVKFTENDTQGITQTDCQVLTAKQVLCNQPFSSLQVTTGSFDDQITVNTADQKKRIAINSGKDDDTVTVNGTPASDSINSDLGEDHISASNAPSYITSGPLAAGGSDIDIVNTGAGGGWVHGGDDGDQIAAGSGNDSVYGEDGSDTISLFGGNDKAWGGNGGDTINAGLGIDELHGQDGNDTLDIVDGIADTLAGCGPGLSDIVKRDNPLDNPAVQADCETVQ